MNPSKTLLGEHQRDLLALLDGVHLAVDVWYIEMCENGG
jgi:hypothetical protein